ncbi:hypothetical protein SEPCBS57363_002050 [Sporothrix epigloea]|uniref:C2H2-type domain-containing protein n=1 Tax=Sporothrix epigloea TaxID=1892477 RepID=A0ABP0DDV5_9PEZI
MTSIGVHDELGLGLSFSQLGNNLGYSPTTFADAVAVVDDEGPTASANTKAPAAQFPPPKTDKPRPHVCTTCQRSFARLEHLKRHERSHTKEKPFQCDYCIRCFARRDLLLRHQQKLHQSTTPAARPRNRRASTASSVGNNRARKSSMASTNGAGSVAASLLGANGGATSSPLVTNNVTSGISSVPSGAASNQMRPRANTISHMEPPSNFMDEATHAAIPGMPPGVHSRHPSLAGLPMHGMEHFSFQPAAFTGMSSTLDHHGMSHDLPKLDTNSNGNHDFLSGPRTAPEHPLFSPDFRFDSPSFGHNSGSTVNPNALHYDDSSQGLALDPSSGLNCGGDQLSWLTAFGHQPPYGTVIEENAVGGSSPSAVSTGSQSGISDVMLDGSTYINNMHTVTVAPPVSSVTHTMPTNSNMWNPTFLHQPMPQNNFSLDLGASSFSDLLSGLPVSPGAPPHVMGMPNSHSPLTVNVSGPGSVSRNGEPYFSTPPPSLSAVSPSMLSTIIHSSYTQAMNLNGGTTPETPNSMNGSNNSVRNNGIPHQISLNTSSPVSTITDATRLAIVNALSSAASQTSPFEQKFSSPGQSTIQEVPSTLNLQRYVSAYLRYFQPHFPFLHVPTMSFDITAFSTHISNSARGQTSDVGGSGCLILSMAAIGALYELENDLSRTLFAMAKRMIQLYLDERRKENVRKADFRRTPSGEARAYQQGDGSYGTPVWLVQAMLLNIIYGHNGIDQRAGEVAATHCAALVSLAQGAELLQPVRIEPIGESDLSMGVSDESSNFRDVDNTASMTKAAKEEAQWLRWKATEERKRTLYAIFVFSSLLVSTYNHTPALTNSEILLDLPCDEELFSASTCVEFVAKGGIAAANHNCMTFHEALGDLLRASEKQLRRQGVAHADEATLGNDDDLKPSTFGCFILINALHNYIWETRQRHHNMVWTNEETEKMHRHIEPSLQAWHRAWNYNNERHISNNVMTYGVPAMEPIAADSLPLLDLAYVRLFVNLARTKELFWQREWNSLAEELCHGHEIVQHAEQSTVSSSDAVIGDSSSDLSGHGPFAFTDSSTAQLSTASPGFRWTSTELGGRLQQSTGSSLRREKREKHLRKAAHYAVGALSMTNKVGYTLADFASRELPLQSALCVFDCAQVLAEWVATVQDRVGWYLGVLDQNIELDQVPAIMLLEEEDGRLFAKIKEVLNVAEMIMNMDISNGTSSAMAGISTRMAFQMQMGEQIGYGAKILSVMAYTLGKASVWPVTQLMAECLENHASHMRTRAEKSVLARVPDNL